MPKRGRRSHNFTGFFDAKDRELQEIEYRLRLVRAQGTVFRLPTHEEDLTDVARSAIALCSSLIEEAQKANAFALAMTEAAESVEASADAAQSVFDQLLAEVAESNPATHELIVPQVAKVMEKLRKASERAESLATEIDYQLG